MLTPNVKGHLIMHHLHNKSYISRVLFLYTWVLYSDNGSPLGPSRKNNIFATKTTEHDTKIA